ncbi:MAG: hypothetical protein ACREDR_23740 [Blastocatellia bacterium]
MPSPKDFNPNVVLPLGLTITAVKKSIDYIEKELAELVDIYFEQANVFSALVGIFGVRALNSFSVYEKNKHKDFAQQRFPDLKRRGGSSSVDAKYALESKGSKRPWEIQSHYDHPGWYIVWRYLVDSTESIESGKPIIIWRVDVVFLRKEDWEYQGSSAGAHGGGRTHTFGLKLPAQSLKGKSVYQRSGIKLSQGKPTPVATS